MKNLKESYEALKHWREPYLTRARKAAELTMPFLVPEEGFNSSQSTKTPEQGFGAHAVRTLTSKILMALLPPSTPFFKFVVNKYRLRKEGLNPEEINSDLEKVLSEIERTIIQEIELSKARLALEGALQHLIVAGNSLLFVPEQGPLKWYKLTNYVLERDAGGNVERIITLDVIDKLLLPEHIQSLISEVEDYDNESDDDVELYTCIQRVSGDTFKIWQEVNEIIVDESIQEVTEDKLPYIPLRFSSLSGEDYGRGLVEEYYGTFNLIENLSRLLNEGAIALGKALIVVDKGSGIRPDQLAKKPNMAIIAGKVQAGVAQDVGVVSLEKRQDYAFVLQFLNELKREIGEAFLLHQVRDAERVTAQEIQMLNRELETVLGGVYSILAHEFQLPLLRALMQRMDQAGSLPTEVKKLPKAIISPMIITGLEALGRNSDLEKLLQLQQVLTPQELQFINSEELLRRKITYAGIPTEGLIKETEQVQAEQQAAIQQQQLQSVVEKAAGPVAKGIMDQQQPVE